jgi:hypothetical protein
MFCHLSFVSALLVLRRFASFFTSIVTIAGDLQWALYSKRY